MKLNQEPWLNTVVNKISKGARYPKKPCGLFGEEYLSLMNARHKSFPVL